MLQFTCCSSWYFHFQESEKRCRKRIVFETKVFGIVGWVSEFFEEENNNIAQQRKRALKAGLFIAAWSKFSIYKGAFFFINHPIEHVSNLQ